MDSVHNVSLGRSSGAKFFKLIEDLFWAQDHIHPTIHALYWVINILCSVSQFCWCIPRENLGATSLWEKIQGHTYGLVVFYLALLFSGVSSVLKSMSLGLEVFPRRCFDIICHKNRFHQYPMLRWIIFFYEKHAFKAPTVLQLWDGSATRCPYVRYLLYVECYNISA